MEFRFARKIRELSHLPPEVLTKVFTSSRRSEEDKEDFMTMLRVFSTASATIDAVADDEPPTTKTCIRASRKDTVSETIGKMQHKLAAYERNHDRTDEWVTDFANGKDYTSCPLEYIKGQYAR